MSFFSKLLGKSTTSEHIKILEPQDFETGIRSKKTQLIDVRTAGEYRGGHIKNATNADVSNPAFFAQVCEKMSREQPVYLYCRSGARSRMAAKKLVAMGFTEIYDLRGGYLRWPH
ncbi:rhodanese-like domain-containing protein [Maribacter sp. 2307ULW6-5]|uniref:rhodanese-like domain-containing protein n=1 Tax=Maribacter sp. 2307ULW6-5 TaxID=3386275 RepID=UPI0039BCEC87